LAKSLHKEVICDIELLYRHAKAAQYVGITGTNGKSTTTALIAHILSTQHILKEYKSIAVGGNLGIPALELENLSSDGIYVLELSSYQLDLLEQAHFDVRILLNITPDHIDHHGSMANYIKAKERIFRHAKKTDLNIIGIDTEESYQVYQRITKQDNCSTIAISSDKILAHGISVINDVIYYHVGEHLAGKHNAQNIAAAFATSMYYNLDPIASIAAIKSFPGLAHRMQYVGEFKHISYINDSKATNADAAAKALDSFANIYWLLGGVAKEGGIETLTPYFSKITHAFLMGAAQEEFAQTLEKYNVPYSKCNTLLNACNLAQQMALRDQHQVHILLSPACASFDQWKNFEERGEHFIEYVKNYCQ
jgi:UDP-N-acetylmuramoylalanine--D-glutamate ligase